MELLYKYNLTARESEELVSKVSTDPSGTLFNKSVKVSDDETTIFATFVCLGLVPFKFLLKVF